MQLETVVLCLAPRGTVSLVEIGTTDPLLVVIAKNPIKGIAWVLRVWTIDPVVDITWAVKFRNSHCRCSSKGDIVLLLNTPVSRRHRAIVHHCGLITPCSRSVTLCSTLSFTTRTPPRSPTQDLNHHRLGLHYQMHVSAGQKTMSRLIVFISSCRVETRRSQPNFSYINL